MLLGTEFYTEPPFEIIEDYTFDNFTPEDLKDFTELEELSSHPGHQNFGRIDELYEKHHEKTNFITLYSNCLLNSDRIEQAQILLESHLKKNKDDIDLRMCLAKLAFLDKNLDNIESLLGDLMLNIEEPSSEKFTSSQFLNFCTIAVLYFLEIHEVETALKVYAWTLKEEYEVYNKQMACLIAGKMIQPMPEKFEDLEEDSNEEQTPDLDTYFHHLDLNDKPFHSPFSNYHNIYLDEIALQDIRAIESLDNEQEIEHDVKWLIKNELVKLQNHKGVFEPAGAKFAFILASARLMTSCFEDLISTLRLPLIPYFDFIFKENFFEFVLNPFYHLGLVDINPLYNYIKEKDHPPETREAVARVLVVIAEENPKRKIEIDVVLNQCDLSYVILPEKYEIIENKIPKLLQHFIDIPVDYFKEDDDFYDIDESFESKIPDSIELPSGGIISKPHSLETAVFSNYMLATMDMQKESQMFEMPPEEVAAPLRPIVKLDKIGRNDPCPCGSGKKYKKCCLNNLN